MIWTNSGFTIKVLDFIYCIVLEQNAWYITTEWWKRYNLAPYSGWPFNSSIFLKKGKMMKLEIWDSFSLVWILMYRHWSKSSCLQTTVNFDFGVINESSRDILTQIILAHPRLLWSLFGERYCPVIMQTFNVKSDYRKTIWWAKMVLNIHFLLFKFKITCKWLNNLNAGTLELISKKTV